jgi:SPP1 family predicted phage head-tail adaptor
MIPAGLMNRTVTIKRKSRTKDGQGGFTFAWATSSTVQGRIRPAKSGERVVAGREQAQITHVAYFDPGTDVQFGDQLVSSAPTALTVYVVGVREPGGINHHFEVDCNNEQLEP